MRIKSYIQSMSKSIYFRILPKKQEKDVEKLSSRLRSQGKYFGYPFNEYPPTAANYSLFRKSDLKWFDFFYSVYGQTLKCQVYTLDSKIMGLWCNWEHGRIGGR